MKRLLILALLFPMIIDCANPDARALYLNQCNDDPTQELCSPLHATSASTTILSKTSALSFVISLNRAIESRTLVDNAFIPARSDTVSDHLTAIRITQPNRTVMFSVPASQIVAGKDLSLSFAQLLITLLPGDLANLIPGESTVIEVDITDWQGDTYTDSLPITITS